MAPFMNQGHPDPNPRFEDVWAEVLRLWQPAGGTAEEKVEWLRFFLYSDPQVCLLAERYRDGQVSVEAVVEALVEAQNMKVGA